MFNLKKITNAPVFPLKNKKMFPFSLKQARKQSFQNLEANHFGKNGRSIRLNDLTFETIHQVTVSDVFKQRSPIF